MPHSSPYNRHARICIPCVDHHRSRRSNSPKPCPEIVTPLHRGSDESYRRALGRRAPSYKWKKVEFLLDGTISRAPKHRWSFAICSDGANVYIQGGVGLNESYRDFWKFNWKTKTWSEIVPNNMSAFASHRLPLLREHIMIMYKNRIYIFGGNIVDTTGLPLWCFDLLTSEWVSLCSRGPVYSIANKKTPSQVPSNLTHHSAVLHNQAIFIFGGYRHVYGVSGELWKYDIESNNWEIVYEPKRNQKGPKAMFGHRAVLYDDAMFVIFGRKRDHELNNDMWKYSFDSCCWTCEKQYGQVPPNLTGAAVEIVGKRMFVVGGKTEDASFNKSIYLFSFAKRKWLKYGIDSEHTALIEATLICVPLALVFHPPEKAATEKLDPYKSSAELINLRDSSDNLVEQSPHPLTKNTDSIKRIFYKQNSIFEASKSIESFGGLHSAEDLSKIPLTRMSKSITSIDDTDSSKDCHPFQYHLLSSESTIFQSFDSLANQGPKNSSKFMNFNLSPDSKSKTSGTHFTYENQSFLNDSLENPSLLKQPDQSSATCEKETVESKKEWNDRHEPDKYEQALVLFGGLTKDYFPGQKSHMEIIYCAVPSVVGTNSSEKSETSL